MFKLIKKVVKKVGSSIKNGFNKIKNTILKFPLILSFVLTFLLLIPLLAVVTLNPVSPIIFGGLMAGWGVTSWIILVIGLFYQDHVNDTELSFEL